MHKRHFVLTLITAVMILSLTFTSAGAIPPASEGLGVDFVFDDPVPYYPFEETVFDKTPEFRFSQYDTATKYRITVRNAYDESIVYYTYKGTPTCEDFECWMTPDIALPAGVVTFENDLKGRYQWTVEAKVAPKQWSGVQDFVDFNLGTAGFYSPFTSDKKGWLDRNGTWALTPAGYLKNSGIAGEYTSTLYKKRVYDDFTFTVRMKLKSASDYESTDPNRHFGGIIIDGSGPLNSPPESPTEVNVWWRGVYVVFRNNQQAAIHVWEGGTYTGGLGWQTCDLIVPDDWNTIMVTVVGDTMDVSINGTLWKTFSHPVLEESGYVGLTNRRYSAESEKMLVDWAKLKVDTP